MGSDGPKESCVRWGGPEVLRDVAMATTFWPPVGYNFGCVTASVTIFDSMGRVSGASYPMKT